MIRNLLATTAIATLLATGAYAQSSTTTTTDPAQSGEELKPNAGAAATQDSGAATSTDQTTQDAEVEVEVVPAEETAQDTEMKPAEDTAQTGTTTGSDTQTADSGMPELEGHLASNLIGARVYNGATDDAENIGEVNDIVIGKDGKAEFAVIGVGGFLGIGEKDVAIEYAELEWAERDGDMWLVLETSKEQLEAQPAFDRTAYDPEAMAAAEQTAATEQPAAGTEQQDTAAAPATTGEAVETQQQTATAEQPAADTEQQQTATAEQPAADTEQQQTATAEQPAAETDEMQTGAIDRSTLQEADVAAISAEQFVGTRVYGANEESIGEIGDVILTNDGQVDAVIVDVGGFLGMGEKEIAVGMDNLQFMQDGDGNLYLYTEFTQEQLEAQPAYDESAYAENRDTMRMTVQQN